MRLPKEIRFHARRENEKNITMNLHFGYLISKQIFQPHIY
jgi:hypothetical protein